MNLWNVPLFHFNADVVLMFLDSVHHLSWSLMILFNGIVFLSFHTSCSLKDDQRVKPAARRQHSDGERSLQSCVTVLQADWFNLRQQVPTLSCDSFGSSRIWRSSQQTAHGVKPQSTTEINETHTLTACYINIYTQ